MTTNYSHDIATALLAVTGATMWILSRRYPSPDDADMAVSFIRVYHSVTKLAKISLIWILVAGVPRILFYMRFEWSEMAGDLQIVAVVIKHVVMFALVGTGLLHWSRLAKKVRVLQVKHNVM